VVKFQNREFERGTPFQKKRRPQSLIMDLRRNTKHLKVSPIFGHASIAMLLIVHLTRISTRIGMLRLRATNRRLAPNISSSPHIRQRNGFNDTISPDPSGFTCRPLHRLACRPLVPIKTQRARRSQL
jgi:hypothetical protein